MTEHVYIVRREVEEVIRVICTNEEDAETLASESPIEMWVRDIHATEVIQEI